MSRAERLLALMQCLRRRRHPVSAQVLADELGVSVRTLYRDIASLQAQGAQIAGEAGIGYVLQPGFLLPPLMFSAGELEALMLGARWVEKRIDSVLATDAHNALAKISAVLPADLRQSLHDSALLVGPSDVATTGQDYLPVLREAIRKERKVALHYRDLKGQESQRVVWPFALGFFEQVRVVMVWCEMRAALRHLRVDRMIALDMQDARYPVRRQVLLKQWRAQEGIVPTM